MLYLACIFLPPILVMRLRHYLLKISRKDKWELITEYAITWLIYTTICFGVLVLCFKHEGPLKSAFDGYTDFIFHYLCLSLFLATVIPFVEFFLRTHVDLECCIVCKNKNKVISVIYWTVSLVFAIIYTIRCFDNSLWGDEAFSVSLARMGLSDMLKMTANDVHPPLYYVFVQIVYRIFGDNGFLYHFVSVIPYFVLLLIGLTWVKKRFGNFTCAIFLIMTSVSNCSITYNVEIRMYSWANLFVFAAFMFIYEIICTDYKLYYLGFLFCSLGAAYTHYYALAAIVLFYSVLLMRMLIQKKNYAMTIIISAMAIVCYLPWLFVFLTTFSKVSSGWWLESIPTVKECFDFIFGVSDIKWMLPVVLVSMGLFLLYESKMLLFTEKKIKEKKFSNLKVQIGNPLLSSAKMKIFFIGIYTIGGVAMIGIVASHVIRPLFITRYLFPLVAVAYLLFGMALSRTCFKKVWCSILIFILLISGVKQCLHTYELDRSVDKGTAQFLNELNFDEKDWLITNSVHHGWTILKYYYPEPTVSTISTVEDIQLDFDQYDDIWLLWSSEFSDEAYNIIREKGYGAEIRYVGNIGTGNLLYVYHIMRE